MLSLRQIPLVIYLFTKQDDLKHRCERPALRRRLKHPTDFAPVLQQTRSGQVVVNDVAMQFAGACRRCRAAQRKDERSR